MKDYKRKIMLLLTLVMLVTNALAVGQYANSSVLSNGKFVKVKVAQSGVYKISYSDIRKMGLDPEKVTVWGYGGQMLSMYMTDKHIDDLPQVAIYKSATGKSSDNDYILFYANGPISWMYTGIRFKHTRNPYSDYGYYFLADGVPSQLLLQRMESQAPLKADADVYTFNDYQLHELDSLNLTDKKGEEGGGREWYGEEFTNGKQRRFAFNFPNIADKGYIYLDLASSSTSPSSFELSVANDKQEIKLAAKASDNYVMATITSYGQNVALNSNWQQDVLLKFVAADAASYGYLNYIEFCADRLLKMTSDGVLYVRNADYYLDRQQSIKFHVTGATSQTMVWDVTQADSIFSVPIDYDGDELTFISTTKEVREYVIITPSAYQGLTLEPINKSSNFQQVNNQNLHALSDIDMVIITPESFLEPSRRLAAEHEWRDGLTVAVVTDLQVYNEFSSGTPEATAYRMLMKMLYDRALTDSSVRNPKYLLLMGDGSFDNRKISNVSATPYLLTYQSSNSINEVEAYATDDYFGFLSDESGNRDSQDTMCIAVGRLPVQTLEQANQMVDKLIRYIDNSQNGKWKTELCFLADDGNSGIHTVSADLAAEMVRAETKEFNINKIYIDSYQQETKASGDSYPLAKTKLDNLLNNGLFFLDYCGHAGYNNICDEQMLTAKEIREMSNPNMGFWVLATCNFARFDARLTSAAEEAVLNPYGGAIALLSSCRTVYAEQNEIINKYVCQQVFARDSMGVFINTIGDAVRKAKILTTQERRSDKNKLPYMLLGDPALRLVYAEDYNIVTEPIQDTLNALSVQTIKGNITTHSGEIAPDFNGKLYVSVYDKMQVLATLDNDQTDPNRKAIKRFNDFPNILFSGQTEVKDGQFEFTFMIPKDIRYNYGNGRIVMYACDTLRGSEAMGYTEDLVIGGSGDSGIELTDTLGPQMMLYLNNRYFVNGSKTHEQPHFYADLSDEHGINTVGSGIGHDLLLVVDDDPKQTYILNENFTAKSGSYQQGQVSFKLSEMSEGLHHLQFRAWDLLNNSSTATLDFEVVKGLSPEIYSVYVYPNPVNEFDQMNIVLEHDRPDGTLNIELMMYDMSGRMVYGETKMSGENVLRLVPSDIGMTAGMYFMKIRISTQGTTYSTKSAKVIVLK